MESDSRPNLTICLVCRTVLEQDDHEIPPERRAPCPVCRSNARIYTETPEAGFQLVLETEDLLLQWVVLATNSIITFGEKTDEGRLITEVMAPWFAIIELLRRDPAAAFQIPHWRWEEIIAGAYHRAGWEEVTLTPPSGDHGRDVIAVRREFGHLLGSVRIIDQVKAYKPGHLVTAEEVRALMGVLSMEPSSKAVLTTTSDFAPELMRDPNIARAVPYRVELINGTELRKRLIDLANPQPPGTGGKSETPAG